MLLRLREVVEELLAARRIASLLLMHQPQSREQEGQMLLGRLHDAGGYGEGRRPQDGEEFLRREALNAVCGEQVGDRPPRQPRPGRGSGSALEQGPQPGFVVSPGAQGEQPRREPIELLAQAIAQTPQFLVHVSFQVSDLAQLDHAAVFWIQAAEGPPVSDERAGEDAGIAAIVLRPGHGVAIPKAIELLGIERVDVKALGQQRIDQRPPGDFERHGHGRPAPAGEGHQPMRQRRDIGARVRHFALMPHGTIWADDADLMFSTAPIDADEPFVVLGH
jgi:hypothetical protein